MDPGGYFPGGPASAASFEPAEVDNRPTRSMMDIWNDLQIQLWSLNSFIVIPNDLFSSWSQPQKEQLQKLMR